MARHRHDPSRNLVGFLVGEISYAVRIESVREIVNPLTIVDVPRPPESVLGVADYRGDVVVVIDMRTRFGLPASPPTRKTKWVVLDLGGRYAALVVDAVTDVFGTRGEAVRESPRLGDGEDDRRGIAGVVTYADEMVFVLDTQAIARLAEPVASAPKHARGA
ncbi:MAG: purine-binding chemotaxis protein CheW [Myxococcales bacterium]|nr:purine-binding chemotaxis protein CheW [Myxococcales bacterium]